MKFKVTDTPLHAHLGMVIAEGLTDFYAVNARQPKRIIMDTPHYLAFRQIHVPMVIPGEDIKQYVAHFHGVPVAYSKTIDGILLED